MSALPTVRNTLDPLPPNPTVRVRLVAPAGWLASGTAEVVASWAAQVNTTTKIWELDLPAQSAYETTGTYYRVEEPGAVWHITVPDTAGPHWLRDLLVDPVPTTSGWETTPRMSQLADATALASATNGQVPTWQASTGTWVPGAAGGGVSDHGGLGGLADDDHPQYHTDARGDARYPPLGRLVTAGAGLTGGGSLAADRTLSVVYGTTAGTAAQGNDTRLSDPRVPTAHAGTHHAGGPDPVTPAGIGAATTGHTHPGVYEPAGAVAAHETAPDPHPGYLTPAEADAAYAAAGHTHSHAPRVGRTLVYVTSGTAGGDTPPDTAGGWQVLTGVGELVIPAAVGDFVLVHAAFLTLASTSTFYELGVAVSGSLVWVASNGTATPPAEGDPAMYPSLLPLGLFGAFDVGAGHRSGDGAVHLVLAVKSNGTGKTYYSAAYPFRWLAINHGPPAA